jgi:hypothetical protein
MNRTEVLSEEKQLQVVAVDLREKMAIIEKAIAWFEMQPGGTEADARRLQQEYASELQQIEAKRSALLQQILHGGGIGFDGD